MLQAVGGGESRQVWRLDLATMQWETMPALMDTRCDHGCCAVRGGLVVIGGDMSNADISETFMYREPASVVEMLLVEGEGAFKRQPRLSCGKRVGAVAIAVDESISAVGQALLLGGSTEHGDIMSTVVSLVDLASGLCTPQPDLLHARCQFAAVRLPDGRLVCAGGSGSNYTTLSSAEVWGPSTQGAEHAAWTWRELPTMSVVRGGCAGCVLSDGRFAVLGGNEDDGNNDASLSSCEALTVGHDEQWELLPPMHEARAFFACAAVAGSIVVAGGFQRDLTIPSIVLLNSAEVFDEVLSRWLRLPCDFPFDNGLACMGSALL